MRGRQGKEGNIYTSQKSQRKGDREHGEGEKEEARTCQRGRGKIDRFADRFMERQRGGELGGGGYWAGGGQGASGTVTLPPEQNSEERKI